METILLSILLEHGKMIEEILGKLKDSSCPILNIVNQSPIRIINSVAVDPVKQGPVFGIDPVAVDSGYKPPARIVHLIVFQMVSQGPGVGIDPVFLNIIHDAPAGVVDCLSSIICPRGSTRAISSGGSPPAGCHEQGEDQES